jgi:hypothetical protein
MEHTISLTGDMEATVDIWDMEATAATATDDMDTTVMDITMVGMVTATTATIIITTGSMVTASSRGGSADLHG